MRRPLWVNGLIVALSLGSLGLLWATRDVPSTSELLQREHKLLPTFRRDEVSALQLSEGKQELLLERSTKPGESGEFRIVKPWPERADIGTLNQFLGALDLASALRPASDVDDARAGLGPDSARRIRLTMAGKPLQIELGAAAPAPSGARYAAALLDGKRRVYVVSQGVASELSVPFEKFREPRLFDYARSDLERIRIERGNARLELELAGAASFFDSGQGRELASREVVERLQNGLSRLASEQLLEPEAARAALSGDVVRCIVSLADHRAPKITLTFGPTCPAAPELALVLREEPGRSARAGCIPREVAAAFEVNADGARLFAPFSARVDEVEELKVVMGDQKLDLARKDSGFVLRESSASEIPLEVGNARISLLLSVEGKRSPQASSALALESPAGEIVIQLAGASDAAHREQRVTLGKARADGSICLRRQADQVVLCVDRETARALSADATTLKGLSLLSFAPSDLSELRLETPGLSQRLLRLSDGSYRLEQPKGFAHDGALVSAAVQTLGTLQAVRWVAAHEEPSFGLSAPRLRAVLGLSAGERELKVGAPSDDGYFARLSPDPGVFVLPRAAFEDLAQPLIDRSLCPFTKSELVGLEFRGPSGVQTLSRQGDTWQGTSVSGGRAAELADAVSALRAELAVHLGAPKPDEGLRKPRFELELRGKNGQRRRLSFGARAVLHDTEVVFARRDDVDATFALAERAARELEAP